MTTPCSLNLMVEATIFTEFNPPSITGSHFNFTRSFWKWFQSRGGRTRTYVVSGVRVLQTPALATRHTPRKYRFLYGLTLTALVYIYCQSTAAHSLNDCILALFKRHPREFLFHDDFRPSLTGVAGIEPALEESKSSALPFGYTPISRQKNSLSLYQLSYTCNYGAYDGIWTHYKKILIFNLLYLS